MDQLQKQICNALVNIFEGGRPNGNYGAVGGLHNDKGHLSYGRSQVSLKSGNLYVVMSNYCAAPGNQYGKDLEPYLERMRVKDITLDGEVQLRAILREAGDDPVMRKVQDDYFDRNFYQPAMAHAKAANLSQALSCAIAYDAAIQGGWFPCSQAVNKGLGPVSETVSEEKWVARYLDERKTYLEGCAPDTVYRPAAFKTLLDSSNWDLKLPFAFRSVHLTEDIFAAPVEPVVPAPSGPLPDPDLDSLPILVPKVPYLRGDDVGRLQKMLADDGLKNAGDNVYGPFTQALVEQFQAKHGLKPDAVVGPQTWAALKAAH